MRIEDQDDVFDFNWGQCDIYAVALHRLYDYPLYVVNGYFKDPEWTEEEGGTGYDIESAHIVVKLPNGKYLDSDGEQTGVELKKACLFGSQIEYIKIEPLSEEEALSIFSVEDQEENIKRVINFIKKARLNS